MAARPGWSSRASRSGKQFGGIVRATPREIGMELLRDFADKLAKQVQDELGISAAKAKFFAQEAAGRLADDWGGQTVYLPKDMIGRLSTRNKQIYRDFNGDNQPELALTYGLSTQCIYRIIKDQAELRMPKQGSLLSLGLTSPQAKQNTRPGARPRPAASAPPAGNRAARAR